MEKGGKGDRLFFHDKLSWKNNLSPFPYGYATSAK